MSAYRHRLKLSNPLESRDGTLAKDAKLKNMVTEMIEGKPWAVKRPGITNSVELPTGLAQGVFGMNGKAYAIVNDSIYGPLSLTNNSGGGGSEGGSSGGLSGGWNLQAARLPCNQTRNDQLFVIGPNVIAIDFAASKVWISRDMQTWIDCLGPFENFDAPDTFVSFAGYLWGYTSWSTYVHPQGNIKLTRVIRSADGIVWEQIEYENPAPDSKFILNMGAQQKVIHAGSVLAFDSSQYATYGFYTIRASSNFSTWTEKQVTNLNPSLVASIVSYNGHLYSIPSGYSDSKSVFKSTDSGRTWFMLINEWGITSNGVVSACATSLGLLVVCSDGTTWASDNGVTWVKKSYTVPSPKPTGSITLFGGDIFMLGGGTYPTFKNIFKLLDISAPVAIPL